MSWLFDISPPSIDFQQDEFSLEQSQSDKVHSNAVAEDGGQMDGSGHNFSGKKCSVYIKDNKS